MIKKLASSIREYKKAALLAPLFVIFEVLMEVLIPLVMAELIDRCCFRRFCQESASESLLPYPGFFIHQY